MSTLRRAWPVIATLLVGLIALSCSAAPAEPVVSSSLVTMTRTDRDGNITTLAVDQDGGMVIDGRVAPSLAAEELRTLTLLVEAVVTMPAPLSAEPDDGVIRALLIDGVTLTVRGIPAAPEPTRQLIVMIEALLN